MRQDLLDWGSRSSLSGFPDRVHRFLNVLDDQDLRGLLQRTPRPRALRHRFVRCAFRRGRLLLHAYWRTPISYFASARSSRTRGATFVPYSSMLVISALCGVGPLAYFRSKRVRPSAVIVVAIFFATVSGEPT